MLRLERGLYELKPARLSRCNPWEMVTGRKMGTGSGAGGGQSLIRTVPAGACPHFPGRERRVGMGGR